MIKKPSRWWFYKENTDYKWRWFWDNAVCVIPFWDVQIDNFNTSGNNVVAPIDLITKTRWSHVTGTANYPEYYLDGTGSHGITYEAGMYWRSQKSESLLLPSSDKFTCLAVIKKQDGVNRDSSIFGISTATASERLHAHCPYSDGTVYFDYGGFTGSKRISVGGLSHSGINAWAFTAGPSGLAIYQNGNLKASNTTAASRTQTSQQLRIGSGQSNADWIGVYFVAYLYHELTASQAKMWAIDPYGPLRQVEKARNIYTPTTTINGAKIYGRWVGDKGRGPNQRFDGL